MNSQGRFLYMPNGSHPTFSVVAKEKVAKKKGQPQALAESVNGSLCSFFQTRPRFGGDSDSGKNKSPS